MSSTLEQTHLENTDQQKYFISQSSLFPCVVSVVLPPLAGTLCGSNKHSEANNALLIPIPVVAKEEMIILNALCEQRNTGMLHLGCRPSGQGALLHLLNVSLHQWAVWAARRQKTVNSKWRCLFYSIVIAFHNQSLHFLHSKITLIYFSYTRKLQPVSGSKWGLQKCYVNLNHCYLKWTNQISPVPVKWGSWLVRETTGYDHRPSLIPS